MPVGALEGLSTLNGDRPEGASEGAGLGAVCPHLTQKLKVCHGHVCGHGPMLRKLLHKQSQDLFLQCEKLVWYKDNVSGSAYQISCREALKRDAEKGR